MVFRQRSTPWHFRRRGNSLASAHHHLAGRIPAPLAGQARRVFDGDAATGVPVAQVTTDGNGYAQLELPAGANFPAVQEGTVVTVATAVGEIVVQGTLEELSGQ